ncbi:unnamed protein product [Heligmosomoides polygyrus]|uniref:Uncharacterized protein n=1 Tax=Heligmosomoides polygyrus TaxID=6339 RepID=A0A183G8J5_HELPZ|nr:unnamed protein product [Heligmosomoides polygyrus]
MLASQESVEDLVMQARNIKYDVIRLTETRRHHPYTPPTAPKKRKLFLRKREQGSRRRRCPRQHAIGREHRFSSSSLTSQIGRLRLKRCGSA